MLHSCGWLEGGLVASFEKFVMDADHLGTLQKMGLGVSADENGQAMDAIREVGPGGHYLGCAHTQANFETAFYRSNIADYNSFERWSAEGSLDQAKRANAVWKHWLNEYEMPALDPAKDEEIQAYIKIKKASMDDAWS